MSLSTLEDKYRFIHQEAAPFAERIKNAAAASHNEAEFQSKLTRAIEDIAGQLDVALLMREQYTLATGRADAVYNRFIIEYENPGRLRNTLEHGPTAHAVQQAKDYIEGVAEQEKHDVTRLLGVAFDGYYYIFVRYRDGHWDVEQPLEVTPTSTERFLSALFSLSSGRALIPENLVEDFGHNNIYSQRATRALYHALNGHSDDKVAKLLEQWQLFFGQVSGYDEEDKARLSSKKELRRFARGMGLKPETTDPARLFYSIHTYFSFLVKAIARLVLEIHAGGTLGTTPLTTLANLQGEALCNELHRLEEGGFFRTLGINNLLEGDFFSWYLNAWTTEVEEALKLVLSRLADYNPATIKDDPFAARDLLKKLYHYLMPREIRHDLGEFYTPDWLAERLLRQLGEPLYMMPKPDSKPRRDFSKRVLDPACGSGTFLILAIRALKENCQRAGLSEAETLDVILNNVVGIDLNPLAVLASRVNYLLAIADLVPYRRYEIEIPVYLADSILTPSEGRTLFDVDRYILPTSVGPLMVPSVLNTRSQIEMLTNLLDEYVTGGFATDVFVSRACTDLNLDPESSAAGILRELYETLVGLHQRGLDSIWARVLKNAFMPMFLEPFDYVVGNPPWINWESLPPSYREQSAYLWQETGLFVHSGMDTILGKGKKDISTLLTYVAADRYLKKDGKLAFVITQSVWKTAGAGQGFRRFRIGEAGPHLRVLRVDDLSTLQVFEGASTRTSMFVMQKGKPTRYPVRYTYWQKTEYGRGLDYDSTLEEVQDITRQLRFRAAPVNADDPTSAWLTARRRALDAVRKVLGSSDYDAHAGACTWANSVYWLEIAAERPDGLTVVRNVTEGAKRRVRAVTAELEPDLLYPLLRGRDVNRWQAVPSLHILMMQDPETRRGIDEKIVQMQYPKTWAYLKRFEKPLRERSGFKRYFTRPGRKKGEVVETGPFYSMFNVGDYTFAPYKVVWTRVGNDVAAGVMSSQTLCGQEKPIIPLETATMVAFDSQVEAHYFCGYINSSLFRLAVNSYSVHGTGGFGSPHILTNVRVPQYDSNNANHRQLSSLSRQAHQLAPAAYAGDEDAQAQLAEVEAQVDEAAAALWGLSAGELEDIRASLAELRGG